MAKTKSHAAPAGALEEFESLADRAADWIAAHSGLVIAVVVAILAVAGGWGAYASWNARSTDDAANALNRTRSAYLTAMGAPPGSLEVPELANPEAAARIREEYIERFTAVAEEHAGTGPAAVAWLEVGDLERASGNADTALEVWQRASAAVPAESGLRGLLFERIAAVHEDAGRWIEAAEAHEAAGAVAAFPLRYWSLADAGRCYAQAGRNTDALVLLERVEVEAPGFGVPDDLRPLLQELRAAAAARS